jgi:hypothetical protein
VAKPPLYEHCALITQRIDLSSDAFGSVSDLRASPYSIAFLSVRELNQTAIALHPCTKEIETGAITRLQPLVVTLALGFLLASALE